MSYDPSLPPTFSNLCTLENFVNPLALCLKCTIIPWWNIQSAQTRKRVPYGVCLCGEIQHIVTEYRITSPYLSQFAVMKGKLLQSHTDTGMSYLGHVSA